jgi:hypothetical protein
MHGRRIIVTAVLAMGFMGQTQVSPGTAPATGAAAPDRSSPKAALVSLYEAMKAGDVARAKACLAFADARQGEIFEMSFAQVWLPLKLMHVMEEKFGEAGRKPFANAKETKVVESALDRVGKVEFVETGDAAAVVDRKAEVNPSAESELTGIRFKKEGGVWLVVAGTFSDLASDMPAEQVERLRGLSAAVKRAVEGTADRVARGEFSTAEEAYADYQGRLRGGR